MIFHLHIINIIIIIIFIHIIQNHLMGKVIKCKPPIIAVTVKKAIRLKIEK